MAVRERVLQPYAIVFDEVSARHSASGLGKSVSGGSLAETIVLTAEMVAWWGRAAAGAGDEAQARRLITMLRQPTGWDGPEWVATLAAELGLAQP